MINRNIFLIQPFFSIDLAYRFDGDNHFPVFFHLFQIPLFRRIELVHDSRNTWIPSLEILDEITLHPSLYDFIILFDVIRPFFLYLNPGIQSTEL